VRLHVLALDGVYVRDKTSGRLAFHAISTPTRAEVAEVAEVAARTAERIEQCRRAHGRSLDPEMQDAARASPRFGPLLGAATRARSGTIRARAPFLSPTLRPS
jgi:hypothetical protein